MNIDFFVKEHRNVTKEAHNSFQGTKILNKFDKFLFVIILVSLALYLVTLYLRVLCSAIFYIVAVLFAAIYLSIKTSTKKNKLIMDENFKNYQFSRLNAIGNLLKEYHIDDDKSLDRLIDCIETEQENYQSHSILLRITKSVFKVISIIISIFSSSTIFSILIEKSTNNITIDQETIKDVLNWLLDNSGNLLFISIMLVVLIIELCYVWHKIFFPFITKKGEYYNEIVSDIKSYRVFKKKLNLIMMSSPLTENTKQLIK